MKENTHKSGMAIRPGGQQQASVHREDACHRSRSWCSWTNLGECTDLISTAKIEELRITIANTQTIAIMPTDMQQY